MHILNASIKHITICMINCGNPQARPDPVGRSGSKPRGHSVNSFYLNFLFPKMSQPEPRFDPIGGSEQSPIYSNIFIYLLKTFYLCYFILESSIMRKSFLSQMFAEAVSIWGKPINTYTFNRPITFNKIHLQ